MVSFTTSEGAPQTMERTVTKLDEPGAIMSVGVSMDVSMDGSDASGSFTSTGTVGSKRGPPSPAGPREGGALKRVKVQQGTDAQLANMVFKKLVNSALDERAVGNPRAYQDLRRKFIAYPSDSDAPSSLELRQTISALTHTVSRLDKGCTQLVVDIIKTTWAGRDNLFFKTYLRFLGNLVSAHSNYIPLVTKMLVHHLALGSSRMCTLPNHKPVTRHVIYDRTHEALEYIMELVPTAGHSTLFPALVAEFPNKSEKRFAHTTYLRNLLRVAEYAPALRSKIIAMVIERVIKIDIEVQADIEDLEEDEGDTLAWELSNPDAVDDVSEGSSDADDDEEPEYISPVQRIKETVDKLDAMLEILFDYFARFFPETPQAENQISAETHVIFEHLLESFDKTILPTYQSRYTQFVVFWAVQKCPRFIDVFLGELIGCATDNNKSQVMRQAAAAYVASFVARAKMMDKNSVRTVVSVLCNWMNAFLVRREGDCSGPDIGKFGSFYSVFQAVMYIFCFRWRDLKIGEEEDEGRGDTVRLEQGERWIPGLLVMQRAIVSKFNPLKACTHIVVNEFARISNFLNFLYCFSIIESNQRSLLGGVVGSSNHNAVANNENGVAGGPRSQHRNALEAYFPFDPYKLKRSMKWVEGYYVEWVPVPGLDPEESEEEEGEEGEEGEEDEGSDEEGDRGGEDGEGEMTEVDDIDDNDGGSGEEESDDE